MEDQDTNVADPNENVAIRDDATGNSTVVTRRQFEKVYSGRGWKIITPDTPAPNESETENESADLVNDAKVSSESSIAPRGKSKE